MEFLLKVLDFCLFASSRHQGFSFCVLYQNLAAVGFSYIHSFPESGKTGVHFLLSSLKKELERKVKLSVA